MVAKNKKDHSFEEVHIDADIPIYTTGVVCKILSIPIWILKQLDREGIVSPPRDNQGKARLYSKRELKKVQHCWFFMKQHDVKIPGLKIILKMERGIFYNNRKE